MQGVAVIARPPAAAHAVVSKIEYKGLVPLLGHLPEGFTRFIAVQSKGQFSLQLGWHRGQPRKLAITALPLLMHRPSVGGAFPLRLWHTRGQ